MRPMPRRRNDLAEPQAATPGHVPALPPPSHCPSVQDELTAAPGRARRPPRRYVQQVPDDDDDDDEQEATGPAQVAVGTTQVSQRTDHNSNQRRDLLPTRVRPQETEFFDINAGLNTDDTDSDSEEPPIPRARAPRRAPQDPHHTNNSVNDSQAGPLDSAQSTGAVGRALDIHFFFEKRAKESSTCKPCRYVLHVSNQLSNLTVFKIGIPRLATRRTFRSTASSFTVPTLAIPASVRT